MPSTLTDPDTQELNRPPVFVDPSGKRRRVVRRIALGVCALLLCYGGVLVAALLGAPIPQSALLPVPKTPHSPNQPQPDPTQASTDSPAPPPTVPNRPQTPATQPRGSQPDGNAPNASASPPTPTPAVTPSATPTLERPNTNAAPTPPGLVKHSNTKAHGNGQ